MENSLRILYSAVCLRNWAAADHAFEVIYRLNEYGLGKHGLI